MEEMIVMEHKNWEITKYETSIKKDNFLLILEYGNICYY
jgi:hypothetical protein